MAQAETDQLIRCSQQVVYDAFTDDEVLTQFWLRRASGSLTVGGSVEWDFMAAESTESVVATELSPPHVIRFGWSDGIDVMIRIEPFDDSSSRVFIEAGPFDGDDGHSRAMAAAVGFTMVLCDLKTLLEGGQSAGIVRDKARLIDADASAG
jgi:uncharacterized protein YndB with AHSA1/START domain